MDIEHYTGYFHDGSVISIKQEGRKIEIWMESAEILPEWNLNGTAISNSKTITGKLVFYEVNNIYVNDKLVEYLKQIYDDGEILRLQIHENRADLKVEWSNYPPKKRSFQFEHIKIQANRIEWENIPNLLRD